MTKRKFAKKKNSKNPPRGPPGFLLTCEPGREFKCRREGREILEYYWNQLYSTSGSETAEKEDTKKSLEEELAQLQEANSKSRLGSSNITDSPLVEFETGCRGAVVLLSRQEKDDFEESRPAKQARKEDHAVDKEEKVTGDDDPCETHQVSGEHKKDEKVAEIPMLQWDPFDITQELLMDLKKGVKSKAPASRFLTRLIPMQVTCASNINDVKDAANRLLKRILLTNSKGEDATTFAIHIKRRLCDHLKREDLISTLAGQIVETTKGKAGNSWKVNLKTPDYWVWVEICKHICGISIVPSSILQDIPNFNIADLQDKRNAVDNNEE